MGDELKHGGGEGTNKSEEVIFLEPGDEKTQHIIRAISHQTAGVVVQILSAEGPLSLSDIAERREISLNAAKYHIDNLLKAGILEIAKTQYSVKGKKIKIYMLKNQVFIVSPTVTNTDHLIKTIVKHRAELRVPDRIILKWNKSGRIIYFNEYGHRFFGFAHEEIIGKPLIGTIVPDKESGSERDLEYMIKDILAQPEKHTINENENITKEGGRVWIRWNNKPIYDENGNFIGMFSIGIDMTECKAVEESIFRADSEKF